MKRPSGLTLIELIVFILIVAVGLVGILSVLNLTVGRSADPIVTKQALAIAEAMLDEVLGKDFANPADGYTGSDRSLFDDVGDYAGYVDRPIVPLGSATPVAGLDDYRVSVTITSVALGGIAAADVRAITVGVSRNGTQVLNLTGYRTRYE